MFDPTQESNNRLLNTIREGMEVRDSTGDKIGKVRRVQMGGIDPVDAEESAREAGPTGSEPNAYDARLLGDLARAFTRDDDSMPDEVRLDLERKGFIQIDSSGLLAADRYAAADQIASVEGGDVVLRVAADVLTRAWAVSPPRKGSPVPSPGPAGRRR
jgi:hypothetical protein